MNILGIETSCDETAAAVVKDGTQILSNIVYSQIDLHKKTGGVVPEVAAREHVVKIVPAIESAIKDAGINFSEIDAVAYTSGPGLLSSLLIGTNAAQTIAHVLKKSLIAVNHVEGHIYANWLKTENQQLKTENCQKTRHLYNSEPKFPILVLTVSGGHNELILWKNHGDYKFLGATLDDAAGEAFDKVARLLGLSYPGGPAIQKAAQNGNPKNYPFPRVWVTKWDFSFSGLKTAVLRLTKEHANKLQSPQFVADVAASFQESVCEVLATKLANAAKYFRVREAHLAGGVSANLRLREFAQKFLPPEIRLRFCEKISLCTDNAAMIASAGYFKFKKSGKQKHKTQRVNCDPNSPISKW